jgi:hypothetical protein
LYVLFPVAILMMRSSDPTLGQAFFQVDDPLPFKQPSVGVRRGPSTWRVPSGTTQVAPPLQRVKEMFFSDPSKDLSAGDMFFPSWPIRFQEFHEFVRFPRIDHGIEGGSVDLVSVVSDGIVASDA